MTTDGLVLGLRRVLGARADVRFAWLFGSSVTRGVKAARDVDVAVSFSGSPSLLERGKLAVALEHAIGRPVDLIDVAEASTLLRWEIVSTGRVICSLDEDALLTFKARTPIEYADLRPYLDREAAGLRKVLGRVAWSGPTS